MRRSLLLLLVACLISASTPLPALAQTKTRLPEAASSENRTGTDYRIELRGQSFTPAKGILPGVLKTLHKELDRKHARSLPPRVHLLVQFTETPSADATKQLADQGLSLLEALSPVTFRAAATRDGIRSLSRIKTLRWASHVKSNLKIAPDVLKGPPYPYQIREGRRVAYTVVFHQDVALAEAKATLQDIGALIETEDERGFVLDRTLIAQIPHSTLSSLLNADPVAWVEPSPAPVKPYNINAQTLSNIDDVQRTTGVILGLSGAGVRVGVWDQGTAAAHGDFGNRVTVQDTEAVAGDHATHVTGTIGGSGAGNANAEGMAPGANVSSYGWTNDVMEMTAAITSTDAPGTPPRIAASNHSYGPIIGWDPNPACPMGFCDNQALFGQYTNTSRQMDLLVSRGLVIVRSAGNDRIDTDPNPLAPPNAANDCQQTFAAGVQGDCISDFASAKNIITVGAVDQSTPDPFIPLPQLIFLTPFSSFGPTDDGRIKPDLVADGGNLTSTVPNQNFDGDGDGIDDCAGTYCNMQGTSMAAPVVTGTLALLMEDAAIHRLTLRPSSYKALLIHSARDLGQAGPDFQTGWGLVDARAAVNILRSNNRPCIRENTLSRTGVTNAVEYPLCVGQGAADLRVTLAWDDPAAAAGAARPLQNDLDLRLIDPNGTAHTPWTLDPANPAQAAVRDGAGANDNVNNVEQVSVLNPAAGRWTVRVTAARLQAGAQLFSLVGVCSPDADRDGVLDCADNCPSLQNADQSDVDRDGQGDTCDSDSDNDGIPNAQDNCRLVINPAQADLDNDRQGDACDADVDGDCIANTNDNCPRVKNCNYFADKADHSLCGNPCAGSLVRPGRVRELVGGYVHMCASKPVNPECFIDGCPWPEFRAVPNFDSVAFAELGDPSLRAISGIQPIGKGRVILPATGTGFRTDGTPIEIGTLLNVKSINELRDRYQNTEHVPRDPMERGKATIAVEDSGNLRDPWKLPDWGRDLICFAIVEDFKKELATTSLEYRSCVNNLQSEAMACQSDRDGDGTGDACERLGVPFP